MFKILKLFYWALRTRPGRFEFMQWWLKDIPGLYGREIRRKAYHKHFGKMGDGVVVHVDVRIRNISRLFLDDRARLGESTMIQADGGVEIGKDVLLGPGVKIWSANHGFSDPTKPIQDQPYEKKKVTIGDGCWIGANAFLMPGVNLGEGCIVSAGAVVGAKDYPAYKIIAGNPARVIGSRSQQGEDAPAESAQ